jgi:hypothetical protein
VQVTEESLTPLERLEACAVASGTKAIARIVRHSENRFKLEESVRELNLRVVESGFRLRNRWKTAVEDEFVHVAPGPPAKGERTVFYLVEAGNEPCAEMLRAMELGKASGEAIGSALGYPVCCLAAYRSLVERGGNWMGAMIDATPREVQGFSACNRLARLFGEWTVLPDYFPCSFVCEESQKWAERITAGVLSLSGRQAEQLQKYLDQAWDVLRRPIRMDRDSLLQLGLPIRMVRVPEDFQGEERVLRWIDSPASPSGGWLQSDLKSPTRMPGSTALSLPSDE